MQIGQVFVHIAAAVLLRSDGRTLLVRKRGTAAFMQPGGKIEAGETAAAALCRELHEELGLKIDPTATLPLGRFEAAAANEPGQIVVAEVFRLVVDTPIRPAAEIEDVVWVDADEPRDLVLAPLTRDHLLPLVAAGKA